MIQKFKIIIIALTIFGIVFSVIPEFRDRNIVHASPVRGSSGDAWADIILGQKNFSEVATNATTSKSLFLPHGVFIDRNNPLDNKMYIDDAGNNRILAYDLPTCLSSATNPLDCQPDFVIGQPDFTSAACNGDSGFQNYPNRAPATASTLCGELESTLSISEGGSGASMAVDSSGNLFFPDFWNNRVLEYYNPFTVTVAGSGDTIADQVWGQPDFSGVDCNQSTQSAAPNDSTLCFNWGNSNNWTAGVDIDSTGNLWVVDSGNNRVLKFPATSCSSGNTCTISKTASLVLGQANFTTATAGVGLNKLHDPSAVRVNSSGAVFVADHFNNRVLKYSSPATGASGVNFGSGFNAPSGVDFDDTQAGKVWITDFLNAKLKLVDQATGNTVSRTIGNGDGNFIGDVTGSLGIDSAGNVFAATGVGNYNNDVMLIDPSNNTNVPTKVLYTPTGSGNVVNNSELGSSSGIVATGTQLITADQGRLLFWNMPSGISDLSNGKAADGVITPPNLNEGPCCTGLKMDQVGHIYTNYGQHNIPGHVAVYDLPVTDGEQPSKEININFNVLGGGTINVPGGVQAVLPAPDASYMWMTDTVNNRIFRVRDPLGASPLVDVILGQTSLAGTSCNQGGAKTNFTLCNPGQLSYDKFGNLYIADHWLEIAGNMRLLEYDAGTFPTNNATIIYGNANQPNRIIDSIAAWEPAFDSHNRMVIGFNPYWTGAPSNVTPNGGWFPAIYNDPLAANPIPTHLNDYFSEAYAATFDQNDNLYVADLDRAKIMVYIAPFVSSQPILTEVTPVPTPASDTTPNYTFDTTAAGTISYGGDCSSSTTSAITGHNTITFNALAVGPHTNCTLTVTNTSTLEVSAALNISDFTIVAPPVLSQVTPVPAITTDTTPSYTFNSTSAGTITYGGACSSSTSTAAAGNNTISFNLLSVGTYSNCTIRVTDSSLSQSNVLAVSTFRVSFKPFGDFNDDRAVDLSDLSILATYWNTNNTLADANNDGIVDLSDLSILAQHWLNNF